MLCCFSSRKSGSSALSTTARNSAEDTPRSSALLSPTVTKLYSLVVGSSSCSKIRTSIQVVESWEYTEFSDQRLELLLEEILCPNRERVKEALCHAKPNVFTDISSKYFSCSEKTCHLLLKLRWKISSVRSLYAPIRNLIDVFPSDTEYLSQSHFDRAFDIFVQFESNENPFHCPGSHIFGDMQCCFSQIKEQVEHHLNKSRSRPCFIHPASSSSPVCLVGTAVAVATAAVTIATHALITLVAVCLPSKLTSREITHMTQLDAASKGACILHDLDTIDRLVNLLYTAVESDKLLARFVLDRGKEKHPICVVVKKFRQTHINVLRQLMDLEDHICLCLAAIEGARCLLLDELNS